MKQWNAYNEKTSALVESTVKETIDLYLPNGRSKA